jgi:hypothetical protein
MFSEIQNGMKYLYVMKQHVKQQFLLPASLSQYAQHIKAMD